VSFLIGGQITDTPAASIAAVYTDQQAASLSQHSEHIASNRGDNFSAQQPSSSSSSSTTSSRSWSHNQSITSQVIRTWSPRQIAGVRNDADTISALEGEGEESATKNTCEKVCSNSIVLRFVE